MKSSWMDLRALLGASLVLLCCTSCGGKSRDDAEPSVTESGGTSAKGGSSGSHEGGRSSAPPSAAGSAPPTGTNSGAGASGDEGDAFVPPEELEDRTKELIAAHEASPSCVDSCRKLATVCDGAGFSDCELECPGPVKDDGKCKELVEGAYACLAGHIEEAIICGTEREPHVRCGVCDESLRELAQGCALTVDCEF